MDAIRTAVFSTELGWMCVASRNGRLHELTFGHRSPRAAAQSLRLAAPPPEKPDLFLRGLIRRLEAYSRHPTDEFRDVPLDLDDLTDFQRAVTQACRRVPLGEVTTYADLARTAGYPKAARAVGQVMASNRLPLIVPCHRVVSSSGSLGGYSARDGLKMKLRLLALEGALCCHDCDCHAAT